MSTGYEAHRRYPMVMTQRAAAKPGTTKQARFSFGLDQFKVEDQFRTEIERRAREIFLGRQASKAPGDALSDWLLAEKEAKARHLLP
jgi:hypothetical protein